MGVGVVGLEEDVVAGAAEGILGVMERVMAWTLQQSMAVSKAVLRSW